MGAPDLLQHLRAAGLTVQAHGSQLTVSPRDRLTDALRRAIRAHKRVLLASLGGSNSTTSQPAPNPDRHCWPHSEAMLFAQAHALQAIFTNLARRATTQNYLKNWEAYLRMALKAQNQCRMTLETLATLKNPPVVFAKQANINHGGQQQVNNGPEGERSAQARTRAHTRKQSTPKSKLLEASDGQRLDTRAASTAGGADPHMAAVGTLHRPAHR